MPKRAVYTEAISLRNRCQAAYREGKEEAEENPDFDPGDSRVVVNGQRHNVLTVLFLLDAIGVPDCTAEPSSNLTTKGNE